MSRFVLPYNSSLFKKPTPGQVIISLQQNKTSWERIMQLDVQHSNFRRVNKDEQIRENPKNGFCAYREGCRSGGLQFFKHS